ncbi:MAG: hypothetical protein K5922_03570 [Clostridiales bacterium]|nr:hypothetical protein [Clostridiales bacterium]
MKKMLALLMALMMALSAAAAIAEEPAADVSPSGGNFSVRFSLNSESISALLGAADENTAKIAETIVGLVNSLSITGASDGVDAELFVNVNSQPVISLAALRDTDSMLILSDIFPNYILRTAVAANTGVGASLDPAQLEALAAPVSKLMDDLLAKTGEAEAADVTMYETVYTVKTPINLTYREAMLMVLNTAKEITSQEGFASLLEQAKGMGFPISFNPESIDEEIKEITEADEEDLPVLDAVTYANEDGNALLVLNVTKDEETTTAITGTARSGLVYEVHIPEKIYLIVMNSGEDGTVAMNLQFIPQEGQLINIDGATVSADGTFSGVFQVKLNDLELGSLIIESSPEGTLTGALSVEGKTEIDTTALQDQSSEQAQGFLADLQMGFSGILSKVLTAYPDLVNLMSLMSPATQE